MTRWEYKIVESEMKRNGTDTNSYIEYITEEQLDKLGEDGWELVAVDFNVQGEIRKAVLKHLDNEVR